VKILKANGKVITSCKKKPAYSALTLNRYLLISQKVPNRGPCPHAIMENINVTTVTILLQNSDVHNALGPDNSTQAQLLQMQIRTPAMIATGPHSANRIESSYNEWLKTYILNCMT